MKADLSRDTFSPVKRFSRVLAQQGRVQLDADFNEQVAILLASVRTLAADLIGRHGGVGDSFKITPAEDDFLTEPGHYYVDGILCENDAPTRYTDQPDYPWNPHYLGLTALENGSYVVYLDVWERHVTAIDDDEIREVALGLGGPDTATRAKVVWQVKVLSTEAGWRYTYDAFKHLLGDEERPGTGQLEARAKEPEATDATPCIVSPEARYRGAENQLYRVEIHQNGREAKFKWSRDNGSVIFAIRDLQGKKVTLERFGRDERLSIEEGDWVELVDRAYVLHGRTEPLLRVESLDRSRLEVTLDHAPASGVGDEPDQSFLRRWDSPGLVELPADDRWIELEDGVQVRFKSGEACRSGDYWLIPARKTTQDIEWPGGLVPPMGAKHHYAPLAKIKVDGGGVSAEDVTDLRKTFKGLAKGVSS